MREREEVTNVFNLQDFGHSKALLEIQYENEVGTGLGPTLEFYALVSAELQRSDLHLWNEGDSYKRQSSAIGEVVKASAVHIEDDNMAVSAAVITNPPSNSGGTEMEPKPIVDPSSDSLPVLLSADENERGGGGGGGGNPVTLVTYVNSPHGLFPIPLARTVKQTNMHRVKNKFRFLGKFMAKAIMDSRLLDMAFSTPFYRWLLGEEAALSLLDLGHIAPEVQLTLCRLMDVVRQRDEILGGEGGGAADATEKNDKVRGTEERRRRGRRIYLNTLSQFPFTDRKPRLGRMSHRRPGAGLCAARPREHRTASRGTRYPGDDPQLASVHYAGVALVPGGGGAAAV